MPIPVDGDAGYYGNTPPNDDTSALPAVSFASEINQADANLLIRRVPMKTSDDTYYGVAGRKNKITSPGPGRMDNARLCNRAGAQLNASSGLAGVLARHVNDVGKKVRVVGKVGGVWIAQPEEITLALTMQFGVHNYDANSVVRWEALSGGAPAVFYDSVGCYVNGAKVAHIFGNAEDPGKGNVMASAEFRLAVADSKGEVGLNSANRKTAPDDISDFDYATFWDGADATIPVPSNYLDPEEEIEYCVAFDAYGNVPPPVAAYLVVDIDLVFVGKV